MKYVISNNGTINGFINGEPFIVIKENPNYNEIRDSLINNKDISNFVFSKKSLALKTDGLITYEERIPSWDGMPIPRYLSEKIMDIVQKGHEFNPVIRFMYNLCLNPEDHSIVELIDFLRNKNLPLTEDGQFLAYKAIRNDYKDIYTGLIDNRIGDNPKVDRKYVDNNRDVECSRGLHVGSIDYVKYYSKETSDPKFIITKVNPLNVVSVPRDHSFQKLRCCEYNVIAEIPNDFMLNNLVYNEKILQDEISEHKLKIEDVKLESNWKGFIKDRFSKVINYLKGLGR